MAPVSDVEPDGDGGRAVSREDCLCPICLELFMEPVTLPCTHTFCKVCFLESVDKATLCCPLCRKRVSTWARLHSRNKSLVNQALWSRIQKTFPQQCTRRQEGQEEEDATGPLFFPKLSEPGAVRQEYEDQINQLAVEKEQECRASEEYIQRLLAEEEQLLLQQQRRHRDDERLARLLSQELNSGSEPGQSQVPEVTPVKKGHIDRFLSPIVRNSSPTHSSMSNKENISVHLNSPTDLDYYGPETDQSEHAEGGTKRKSSEVFDSLSDQEEDETQAKHSCQSSCPVGGAMAELEAELQMRRQQEEEDRRVALMLQRELNQRQTDRSKGSVDAYLLRTSQQKKPPAKKQPVHPATSTPAHKHRASATITSQAASSTGSTPAAKRQSTVTTPVGDKPPPAPFSSPQSANTTLSKTPQRQTTLTDLFSSKR